jgi:hypothetical protein
MSPTTSSPVLRISVVIAVTSHQSEYSRSPKRRNHPLVFRALQLGPASRLAPIEKLSLPLKIVLALMHRPPRRTKVKTLR